MARFTSEAQFPVKICKEISIVRAAGTHAVNVFQVFGTVRIVDQAAEITEVTTLTNCTAVYATLWDGTSSKDLTADGAILSGAPVGTFFTKDQEVTQIYSVNMATEGRVNEILKAQFLGKPFTITQKSGVDTFIRFHFTTTDDPISFKMLLRFEYTSLDGGHLNLLL
jgi:hypothetical protein